MSDAAEAVGSNRLRLLLLPGLIVSLYAHPYALLVLKRSGYSVYGLTVGVVFAAEVLFLGILISSAMKPIYYIFEGFRLTWVTASARKYNNWKVDKFRKKLASLYSGGLTTERKEQASRLLGYLSDFPNMRADGRRGYFAERPTRLGNIIASYELYPKTRYGIDGVSFWFHLLYKAPEAARQDYKDKMVFAESLVLASAAGVIVFISASCSLVGQFIGRQFPGAVIVSVNLPSMLDWIALASGVCIWAVFYMLALSAHREVRDVFWALTDLAISDFMSWAEQVNPPVSERQKKKAKSLSEFLRYLQPLD